VFPSPLQTTGFAADEVRAETRALGPAVQGRLIGRLRYEVQLLHLPSMVSVRAWTDGSRTEALERVELLLRARVAASQAGVAEGGGRTPVVRRYALGPAPLVRDVRTGRSTGRLDQVFEGHLDIFLTPPREGSQA
jgi:hypothetical protein